MRSKTEFIVIALLLIYLLWACIISTGLLSSSVTVSSAGTVSDSPLKPNPNYNYTMAKDSTSTYIIAHNGTIVYSDISPTVAYSKMLSYIAKGGSYYVKAGIYTGSGSKNFYLDSINNTDGVWEDGAIFTIANYVNLAVMYLQNANNNTFTNLQINGNGFTSNDHLTPLQTDSSSGWVIISGNHNTLQNSSITNVKRDGVQVFETSPTETGNYNTVKFCNITYCGWNSITFGSSDMPPTVTCGYNNASFNYCAHNGDLGISLYGYYDVATNNKVENMLGVGGSLNSMWGIAAEGGGHHLIANNTVCHCKVGINVDDDGVNTYGIQDGNYTIVQYNNVTNCATGIGVSKSFNVVQYNIIQNCSGSILPNYSHHSIGVYSGYNCTVQFNTITGDNNQDPSLSIYLAGANHAYILNNTITTNVTETGNPRYGVITESGSGVKNTVIYGNKIQSTTGIYISDASCTNNYIYANNLANCTYGIVDYGTGTLYTNPFP